MDATAGSSRENPHARNEMLAAGREPGYTCPRETIRLAFFHVMF